MKEASPARITKLRAVSLFADLASDERALAAISGIMREQVYPAGAVIIEEGKVGSELFILTEGRVSVYKTTPEGDPFTVAVLGAESYPVFGESGLIESEPRSATIRADSDAHCLILDRETFDRFGIEHPNWALPVHRRVSQAVMNRFKRANHDLMLLYKALMAEIRGT
jgi:CRP/FNR family cyclic AMP-dependent transcriptional regulator